MFLTLSLPAGGWSGDAASSAGLPATWWSGDDEVAKCSGGCKDPVVSHEVSSWRWDERCQSFEEDLWREDHVRGAVAPGFLELIGESAIRSGVRRPDSGETRSRCLRFTG